MRLFEVLSFLFSFLILFTMVVEVCGDESPEIAYIYFWPLLIHEGQFPGVRVNLKLKS